MTADAFDRLLYTDCRAGTGRGAGGGFQVQAQSAGVDSAQSQHGGGLAALRGAERLDHAAPPGRATFRSGFAHACEAGYGTAQSRYVGKEATGGRQGNHLADCLLTRDPDLYGPTRPAQLWRSRPVAGRALGHHGLPAVHRRAAAGTADRGRRRGLAPRPPGPGPRSWPGCSACWRTRRAGGS